MRGGAPDGTRVVPGVVVLAIADRPPWQAMEAVAAAALAGQPGVVNVRAVD